ncbi:Redox-sensing transcriptional repressor Rex [hydrothermal vent metagenome]|uniref:Redox-sensing transcriptional repressor Rex n=1 Tax=hydrothermal vent metagenome TaxID=652676 RepID=A0A3B1DEJ9_9ZZZZ
MLEEKKSIIRLSRYKSVLQRFKNMGLVKVFSDNLGDAIGVVASQVRKDFASFCISGSKKGGYQIDDLLTKINQILGKDQVQEIILVGVGHIGKALIEYKRFELEKMKIVAAFDIDPEKVDSKAEIPAFPLEKLEEFVKKNNIKIGILAIPEIAVHEVAEMMFLASIKGILNFAPVRITYPEGCFVRNVNLVLELEHIIYHVNSLKN